MNRRSLLLGLGAALAAPAVVRAESLMKLWVPPTIPYQLPSEILTLIVREYEINLDVMHGMWSRVWIDVSGHILREHISPERVIVPYTEILERGVILADL